MPVPSGGCYDTKLFLIAGESGSYMWLLTIEAAGGLKGFHYCHTVIT